MNEDTGRPTTEAHFTLPRAQAKAMIEHARRHWPEEVCGLLARDEQGQIVEVIPVPNVAENRRITYKMEPQAQHRAFMRLDDHEWSLAAIYHSHPETQAYPSATDQRLAFDPYDGEALYPDTFYLILSMRDQANPEIRAFLLPTQTEIVEVPVEIVE